MARTFTTDYTTRYTTDGSGWQLGVGDFETYGNYDIPSREEIIQSVNIWNSINMPLLIDNKNKGGKDMRYLYEVILVNPKNDAFEIDVFVAKTETSALMQAYDEYSKVLENIEFDDLKTQCRILMEWKKEKDLKKAIETIKEAVE